MLTVIIEGTESYDAELEEFVYSKSQTLILEHSLVSISKWESKWKKAFMSKVEKTNEETLDYIRCMTVSKNFDDIGYKMLTAENIKDIRAYIDDPMSATIINQSGKNNNKETITSELIYYWMTSLNIPFECQKWHLNRLLTFISLCNLKNSPKKKMNKREILENNKRLNEERRAKLNTTG